MRCEVVAIGTELLLGIIVDSNSAWIGEQLALAGIDSYYQVKVGDYMGQNYGRVVRISESDLLLREVVQDAAGEWIERNSTLQLLERGAR